MRRYRELNGRSAYNDGTWRMPLGGCSPACLVTPGVLRLVLLRRATYVDGRGLPNSCACHLRLATRVVLNVCLGWVRRPLGRCGISVYSLLSVQFSSFYGRSRAVLCCAGDAALALPTCYRGAVWYAHRIPSYTTTEPAHLPLRRTFPRGTNSQYRLLCAVPVSSLLTRTAGNLWFCFVNTCGGQPRSRGATVALLAQVM